MKNTRSQFRSFLFLPLTVLIFVAGLRAREPQHITLDDVDVRAGHLAEELKGIVTVGRPDISNALPPLNGLPTHLRYAFDQDQLSADIDYTERQIVVFPVEEYRALFRKNMRTAFDRRLAFLKEVMRTNIGEHVKEIPIFPPVAASQRLHTQVAPLRFSGGTGIRFVASYSKEENTPITNKTLFYVFQGMTKDGKYLVVFFYPVSVRNLPISEDAAIASLYMDQIPPESFTPNLTELDRVSQLITIRDKTKKPSPK